MNEECPYCECEDLDAEYVHNGLGMVQVTPKQCMGCGALEIGRGYNDHYATEEELKNGYLKGPDWEKDEHEEEQDKILGGGRMSTVIKNRVHKARVSHDCDDCRRIIWPGEKYRRLYGSAHDSDPRYEIKLCLRCTDTEDDGHIAMYIKE